MQVFLVSGVGWGVVTVVVYFTKSLKTAHLQVIQGQPGHHCPASRKGRDGREGTPLPNPK